MNCEVPGLSRNLDEGDLLDVLADVTIVECREASAFGSAGQSDTWIGKIPCSAVAFSITREAGHEQ